jgi:hypothetical protein
MLPLSHAAVSSLLTNAVLSQPCRATWRFNNKMPPEREHGYSYKRLPQISASLV